ncbi:transcriptional regulator, TetR family [Kibdelosporangium aridum]|uniref:Transcriptional regulator, TetR family n=1 Tax=Kibdelosporangium aridum TaxID=2030 RepID=A0A1W2FVG1_KIBAR|nr:transcriptional regulator, TetR family [Kibdelosporangium aridum]
MRQRTRRAVLDAALSLWSRDFSASLGDIADRAQVSRSTLHRYFPDRQALVDAALVDATETIERVSEKATASCTTAAEELDALMRAMIDVGDLILFLFSDAHRFKDNPYWTSNEDQDEQELATLITRAQQQGALAADVAPSWAAGCFYALVFAAAESISAGTLPRHLAADLAVRTFLHGLASH